MNRATSLLMGPPVAIAFPKDLPSLVDDHQIGRVGESRCLSCGCTDSVACEGGCWWAAPGLCSRCAKKGAFLEVEILMKDPVAEEATRYLTSRGGSDS